MNPLDRLTYVRRLGITVVALTLVLMVMGSWVKATGSGLACPDWPQCYGQWFPPFPAAENGGINPDEIDPADAFSHSQVMYEWTHRLLAAILGLPILAFAWLSWRGTEFHRVLRTLPAAAVGILVLQAGIGGVTVIGKNAAPLTTLHLAMASLFLVTVTVAACWAWLQPFDKRPPGTHLYAKRGRPVKVQKFPGED